MMFSRHSEPWGVGEEMHMPPHIHADLVPTEDQPHWQFQWERVEDERWAYTPWPHSVIITVEELSQGALDALFSKAQCTRRVELLKRHGFEQRK